MRSSPRNLQFPTSAELVDLAGLAEISRTNRDAFAAVICGAIRDAHSNWSSNVKQLYANDVVPILEHIEKSARRLDTALRAIATSSDHPAEVARYILIRDLSAQSADIDSQIASIGILVASSSRAIRQAKSDLRARGRRAGAGGNVAFNWFIDSVYMAAWQNGGHWTNYRGASGRGGSQWNGTLLRAMAILRPYLPAPGFFPVADLGRSLDHISKQLKSCLPKSSQPTP